MVKDKFRLFYCLSSCLLLLLFLLAGLRIQELEGTVNLLQAEQDSIAKTAARFMVDLSRTQWEIIQWRRAVESRDDVIAWLKAQPPQVEVPRLVEVIKEVQVIKQSYVPIKYQEWQSLQQFEDMFRGAATAFSPDACLSIAEQIQQTALEQGYAVSIGLTYRQSYYGQFVTTAFGYHAGVVINVQGTYYFIDPSDWRVTKLF